ncbi:MAG TPA: hypothetical protein VFL34_02260 [Candidatus Sulfotelmatobacter sp.]|nr:hypothetical protein [Candidatus Sulfotelmatobacter sp.]
MRLSLQTVHARRRMRPGGFNARVGLLVLLSTVLLRAAEPATVTFKLDFPGSDPDHYSIAAHSDGSGHYECSAKISEASDDRENYQTDFTFSDATRARIFALAAQAHYFSAKIDSGKRNLANTGAKTLSYKDGQREFAATYNYSSVPPAQQLTTLFQSISATLEFGRRLSHYHRYQKLALDEELKLMEDQARQGSLVELQAVRPVLQEIYDDSSVINVVRARAQRIMAIVPDASGAH